MIGARAKSMFLDRPKVVKIMDRATRRVFFRFGGFVRTVARRSIRKRKRVSEPGEPPSSHSGELRNGIFFGFDPVSRSMVIGPDRLNQVFFRRDGAPARGTVPRVLEEGGQVHVRQVFRETRGRPALQRIRAVQDPSDQGPGGWWARTGRRQAPGAMTRTKTTTIEPRPYMQPAFEKGLDRLDRFWSDSVSR